MALAQPVVRIQVVAPVLLVVAPADALVNPAVSHAHVPRAVASALANLSSCLIAYSTGAKVPVE